jgi:O-succinylbenzoic acid--CoA ligase
MHHWLFAQAEVTPHAPALVTATEQFTYDQLATLVREDMGRLATWGIKTGDVVGVYAPNTSAYVRLIHALIGIGAVLVPLNIRLTPDELDYQIQRVSMSFLLMDDNLSAPASPSTATLTWSQFEALSPAPIITPPTIALDKIGVMMFTSGTSGKPKAVCLTVSNLVYSARASQARLQTATDDRWLCVLPLYHVGGLSIVLRCALDGMCITLLPRFDADAVHEALIQQPITLISLVPTMLYRLLEGDVTQWRKSLRLILLGGAAADMTLLRRCASLGLPIATTYGLTEASSQVCTTTPNIAQRKPASVGKALDFIGIRVVDEHGQNCPVGDIGEVVVSGKTVMQGYFDDESATAKAIRDGLLYTGDMGYLDADGDLWLVQRRSDLIVTGGENVYPAEIEAVLRELDGVRDVAVVGIPDPEWGQKVACLLVGDIDIIDIKEAEAFLREKLAGYKVPRHWKFADALPLNATGKIDRGAVRAMLEEML